MHPILEGLDARDRRLLRRRAMPAFTPLMLATLAKHAFSDPAWVFEAKLDGQRSLLWKRRTIVRLITRNQKDRTSHYPDLVEAVRRDDTAALIADGEIVASEETSPRSRAYRSGCRTPDPARRRSRLCRCSSTCST